jgi:hypothetical protein
MTNRQIFFIHFEFNTSPNTILALNLITIQKYFFLKVPKLCGGHSWASLLRFRKDNKVTVCKEFQLIFSDELSVLNNSVLGVLRSVTFVRVGDYDYEF